METTTKPALLSQHLLLTPVVLICGFDFGAGDFFHALRELSFAAFAGGAVVATIFEAFGQALHVGYFAREIVRVLVVLAVVEVLQQACWGVAQM